MSVPMVCPNGCDLTGPEIPVDSRDLFGGATHFSDVIGVQIPGLYDGTAYWACPRCYQRWHRFTGDSEFDVRIRTGVQMDWDA